MERALEIPMQEGQSGLRLDEERRGLLELKREPKEGRRNRSHRGLPPSLNPSLGVMLDALPRKEDREQYGDVGGAAGQY
jgi:hypothetical protein